MVPAILHAAHQRRHRCKEQTFGLCGVGEGESGMVWRIALKHVYYYM